MAPVARMYWGETILLHAEAWSKPTRRHAGIRVSWLQQFRIVFLKHRPQHGRSALFRGVYFLN